MPSDQQTRKIRLGLYKPHKGQLKLHNAKARFRVSCWGRRAGKTFGCCNEHVKKGVERRKSLNWWVAPTYKQAQIAFENIVRAMRDQMVSKPNYTQLKFKLYSSEFEFRSAKNPDDLRGDGVHFLTMDECRDIKARAWFEVMMPMLTDTDGEAVFISTPQGHDWFYHLYQLGQDPLQKEYWSFNAPSMINPYLPLSFIEEMRSKMPEDKFEQEILAVFRPDQATVFKRVNDCIRNPKKIIQGNSYQEDPIPGHYYILGWDPAKHTDFSVITVLDCNTGHLVAFDRDNGTDYRWQIVRVLAIALKYNRASIVMDATGVGDPLLEQIREADFTVEGIVWNNPKKKEMVERLQLATEHQQISLPNIAVVLQEIRAYSYKISASGNIIYGAPDSQEEGVKIHDDCVSSLMMAVHSMSHAGAIAVASSGSSTRSRRTEDDDDDKEEQGHGDDVHRQANLSRLLQGLGGLRMR